MSENSDTPQGYQGSGLIADPTSLFRSYCDGRALAHSWYDGWLMGRMAMALEVVTVIRTLEGVVGQSLLALNREEIISVLRTLLRDQGLWDEAEVLYERLLEWRKPTFVAEGVSPDALASELSTPEREAPPALDSPSSPAQLRMTRSSLSREESTSE